MAPKLCEDPSLLVNGTTGSSASDSEELTSLKESMQNSTMNDTSKMSSSISFTASPSRAFSFVNTLATYVSKMFGLVLILYFLGYQHENLNYFLLVGRVVWLFCLVLCCYQEDILDSIFGTSNVTSSSRKPCTIEYNTQVKLIVGLVSYVSVTYLVMMSSSATPNRSTINGMDSNTTRYLSSTNFTNNSIGSAINNDVSPKSYLFYVFGLLASYYSFEKVFTEWFCRLPSSSVVKVQQPSGSSFGDIERVLGVPTCLILMYLLKDVTTQDASYQSLITTLYGWFAFKIVHLALELNNNRKLKSYTLPAMLANTPLGLRRIAEDAKRIPNSKVGDVNPPKYVWRMYGNEYDVTDYVHKHPGGIETIMLAANREDSTAIFQSYHPFNITKARTVLEKYRINKKSDDKPFVPGSLQHDNDLFYNVLVERVRDVLKNKYNIDPLKDRTAPPSRVLFYSVIITGVIASLVAHCRGNILGSFFLAFFGDLMAAHLGHDGGHFAVSHIPLINDICVWGMAVASNPITWQHQHTYAHHSNTNDELRDPDLHHFTGMIKLHPDRADDINRYKAKKNNFYIIMMFCQVTMGLCVWMPLRFVLDRSMHGVVNWTDRKRWWRTIGLLSHWVAYTIIVMIIPVLVHKSGWMALIAYITHSFTAGLMFALVTQVGHLSEPTLDNAIAEANRAKRRKDAINSWAAEQVEHSVDFEPHSWLWFVLAGGLGLQIEHHLFPGLNHWHLMKIQPIIKQTCLEYGVDYKSYDNYFDALRATLDFMKKYQ